MGLFKGLFDLVLGEGASRDVFGPTKQERRVIDNWVQASAYKSPTLNPNTEDDRYGKDIPPPITDKFGG